MKASVFTMIVTIMATVLAAAEKVSFDDMKAGMPPPGWTATQTGSGTAKWSVEKDASGEWHTLRVDFSGAHFTVMFDGKKAIEWDDDTFKNAGKVGVWTKADSVTLFDDFTYGSK